MPPVEDRVTGLVWLGVPLIIMLVGDLMILPPGLAVFCGLWIILSLPLGIAVGHCALSEDETTEPH